MAGDRLHVEWSYEGSVYYRERGLVSWTGPAVNLTGSLETLPVESPGITVLDQGRWLALAMDDRTGTLFTVFPVPDDFGVASLAL